MQGFGWRATHCECPAHWGYGTPGVRPGHEGYVRFKTLADRLIASVLLLLALPFLVVAMALVRLTSRGPAIYSQVRVGLDGKRFRIYKVRSMYNDCERSTGPRWCTADDPRVTPVGDILRKTHLDELPQLWNVLRGEMSLIGPRPERPEFVSNLEKAFPYYRDRLRVLPGITGLAQVQLPPDTDLTGVERKLMCDLYYIGRLNPLLDLKIVICTGLGVIGVPFAAMRALFGMPSVDAMECTCGSERVSVMGAAQAQAQPA
ncbi:Putative undecaprenyl-phosphate N-acetylgalactosaminyl 1-phosphate transferase (plasmid) [Tautonia plasticadhaerens]|uniref:Undecaprenyl-phosphate N-acetylgalactosaminyl 1-phosphate transferase n=2 Tax=Tautonia plasticadhaerens TaxID=2527974 RepID=A0A518HFS6_9BACT|nr:Putative undecaprenyl-phosphate N-acetylgalactosaminyl 1-phosphate transferase [Tautonia plasticadhaerens]